MRTLLLHAALLLFLGIGLLAFPPYGVDPESVLYSCSIVVALICLWCLVSWRMIGGMAFEPYMLFLIAAICFNAGHVLLYACGVKTPSSVMALFSSDTSLKTMILVAIGLASFHFGGLAARQRRRGTAINLGAWEKDVQLRALSLVGAVLFSVSLPAWLFVTYERAGRVMQYGYFVARFGGDTPTGLAHLPELLSDALAPAMIFILASSKDRPARRRSALAGVLGFGAITLFTGSKGPAVMAFLAFGWVWHRSVRPLRVSVLSLAALALGLVIIPLTTAVREIAGRDRTSIKAMAETYSGIDNPVVAFLSETGWTSTTVAHTIELVPAIRGYDYGQSYLYAVLAVLPNFGGGLHPAREHGFLADWLVSTLAPEYAARGGGWGYSFIGEAYANFGLYGASLALAAIGFLLSRLFTWAQSSDDPAKIAMVGGCVCNCLLYARGESGPLLREIIWYALIPYLSVGLLTSRRIARYFPRRAMPHRYSMVQGGPQAIS